MNDCIHCNAQLFPVCQCLTSSNKHSDSDLSLPLSQYATHTDEVISNALSLLHCNTRSLHKNIDKLEESVSPCSILPDIIALLDTRFKETSNIAPHTGYNFHHYSAAAVYNFWLISSLAFMNIFKCVKTLNVQCDNFRPFSPGGLTSACNAFYFNEPYNHFAYITFYTQRKIVLLIHCPLYTTSSFALGWSAAHMTSGPSQPPTPSRILWIDILRSYRSSTL